MTAQPPENVRAKSADRERGAGGQKPKPQFPEYLGLRHVGCDRELFATDAAALLYEATAGAMRDLDPLAAAALRETAKKKRKLVDRA